MKAIERNIQIDGADVKFAASASLPRLYRNIFGADFWTDYEKVINDHDYEVFQNFAYCMAYHAADGDICSIDEWCAQFTIMGFMGVLSDVMGLLTENQRTTAEPKN